MARKVRSQRVDPTMPGQFRRTAVDTVTENPFYPLWRVSNARFAFFYGQLADMLHAGMTIRDAMQMLADRSIDRRLRKAAAAIVPALAAGQSFSSQLARFPELFPDHIRGMFRAGEASGELDITARQISEEYFAKQKNAWKVMLAKVWFSMPLFLIPFVLPLPRAIDLGWPWYFQTITHISIPVVIAIPLGYQVLKVVLNVRAMRNARDWLLYYLPGAGMLLRSAALRRYLATLDSLIRAGVQIQQAMEIAAETAGNRVIERQLAQAAVKVRQRMPIGVALKKTNALPDEVRRSLEIAERSGSYDNSLSSLRQWAEDTQNTKVKIAGIAGYTLTLLITTGLTVATLVIAWKAYFDAIFAKAETLMP